MGICGSSAPIAFCAAMPALRLPTRAFSAARPRIWYSPIHPITFASMAMCQGAGEFAMASGEMTEAEFIQFLSVTLGQAVEASRDGALHYVCMDWRHLLELLSAGREIYDGFLNLC